MLPIETASPSTVTPPLEPGTGTFVTAAACNASARSTAPATSDEAAFSPKTIAKLDAGVPLSTNGAG